MHAFTHSDISEKEPSHSESFDEHYTHGLHSSTLLGTLPTLLRWKGSIYRALFPWMPIYIAVYYGVHYVTTHCLEFYSAVQLRNISNGVAMEQERIPVLLVLGVLIHQVLKRWWDCVTVSPEVINPILLACFVFPEKEEALEHRRYFCRIVKASFMLTFRGVAESVKNKYPDHDSFVEQGILTPEEAHELDYADRIIGTTPKPWLTLFWAQNCISHLQQKGELDSLLVEQLKDKTFAFQRNCSRFVSSYCASISLFAVQFGIWTVHMYGLVALWGNQYVQWWPYPHPYVLTLVGNFYVPFFSWLKYVAFYAILQITKTLLYPFGQQYENKKMLGLVEEQFKMTDIIQHLFDDPEALDLQATLFTDEGEVRPYFYEDVRDEEASLYDLLEYYSSLQDDDK